MAYLKAPEVRSMKKEDRDGRLKDLRQELMHERGVAAMGGSPPSPGRIRQLRRQIARILTINREDKLGIRRNAPRTNPETGRTVTTPPAKTSTPKKKTKEE